MATRYSYPIDLHRERDGGYSVTFPDFDEAFSANESSVAGRVSGRASSIRPAAVSPGRRVSCSVH